MPQPTEDEESIIRYAAGYVALKLLKKYENMPEFVECLSAMAVAGDDSSLLEYTCKWTRQVNRGGLYEVGDMCYSLFREIGTLWITIFFMVSQLLENGWKNTNKSRKVEQERAKALGRN